MAKYWVGNGGNWNDTNHWSSESGGVGGAGEPAGWEDAIFDANSFTLADQVVNVATTGACNNLDLRGVVNSPTFNVTDGIYIWRTGWFNANINWTGNGYVIFASDVATKQVIDTFGIKFTGLVRVANQSEFDVISNLRTTGDLDIKIGKLNFLCSLIECATFWCDTSANIRQLNLGTSVFQADFVLDSNGNLTIEDTDYTLEPRYWFNTSRCSNIVFNRLKVRPNKTAIITDSNSYKHFEADGGFIGITVGTTQKVTSTVKCIGVNEALIPVVDRDDVGQFTFDVTGANVQMDYCYIRGMKVVGGPITVYRSFDGGRNEGVIFNPGPPPSPNMKFNVTRSISFARRYRR